MRVSYDQEADALYLRFDDSRIVDSEEVRPGIVLDFNEQDQVVGIEMLDLRKRGIPMENLKQLKFSVSP